MRFVKFCFASAPAQGQSRAGAKLQLVQPKWGCPRSLQLLGCGSSCTAIPWDITWFLEWCLPMGLG